MLTYTFEQFRDALRSRKGLAAIEYVLLAAGVIAGVIFAANTLPPKIAVLFASFDTNL